MNIKKRLLDIVTYHGDDGTSGYLLDEKRIDKIIDVIKKVVESVPLEKNDIANERNRYRFNTYLNGYIDGHQACFEQIEQWKKKILKA